MLRFGKTSGLSGALFVVSDCVVFFAKRTRRQGPPKLANFAVDKLSPKGVFRHLSGCSVWLLFGASAGVPFVVSPCFFF